MIKLLLIIRYKFGYVVPNIATELILDDNTQKQIKTAFNLPHSNLCTSSHSRKSCDKSDIIRASPTKPRCATMTNRMAENEM